MPSITINEHDLTLTSNIDVKENIVYVPGISTQGETGVPTLCRTLKEFTSKFGEEPYVFKEAQTDYDTKYIAGSVEPSFIYATELISAGIPVYFENIINPTDSAYANSDKTLVSDLFNKFKGSETENSIFNKLTDKWTYNIKFITTGGYGIFDTDDLSLVPLLSMVAAARGDCIALVDHKEAITGYTSTEGTFSGILAVQKSITDSISSSDKYVLSADIDGLTIKLSDNRDKTEITSKYSAVFSPWATYEATTGYIDKPINLPGSFAYLMSLAKSVYTYKNPNYLAIAGITRGLVPNLRSLVTDVTGAEAEAVQNRDTEGTCSINPIVYVQNYGYCIWGNRTLQPNANEASSYLIASSFQNVRVLAADVKKVIYQACQELSFETNTTELWLKFKSKVEPELNSMIANEGLQDFELRKVEVTERATLSVYVKLYCLYAVEDFIIDVNLTDSTVETSSR